jgi:DNA polymerase-3 subunit alpha
MAGLLSNEINNTEKISVFVGECKRMGVSILPPDINRSGLKFTPETVAAVYDRRNEEVGADTAPLQKTAIRYGLAAIKHVGESAMEMSIATLGISFPLRRYDADGFAAPANRNGLEWA